jgi:hypothetical protein
MVFRSHCLFAQCIQKNLEHFVELNFAIKIWPVLYNIIHSPKISSNSLYLILHRKNEEQKYKEQKPKANENKPVMTE